MLDRVPAATRTSPGFEVPVTGLAGQRFCFDIGKVPGGSLIVAEKGSPLSLRPIHRLGRREVFLT